MNRIRDRYTDIDYKLIERSGTRPINNEAIEEIKGNHPLWIQVMYLLGLLEHLAVGSNTGVFDLKVLNRMSGGHIIRIHEQFSQYIESQRSINPRIYIELSTLVQRLQKLR